MPRYRPETKLKRRIDQLAAQDHNPYDEGSFDLRDLHALHGAGMRLSFYRTFTKGRLYDDNLERYDKAARHALQALAILADDEVVSECVEGVIAARLD